MIRESIDGRCWNWWLTLCRVAAAFQITRIGWTGTPDFPTVVANAEHAQGASTPTATPIIDAHAHLQARGPHHPHSDFGGAAAKALEGMDREGIGRTIVLPPPFSRTVPPNTISRTSPEQ
jgi:hypothetical protein